MSKPFDPAEHNFVLVPKINPQGIEHYELNNHSGADGSHDFVRMNIYLARDGDFVNIWYGSVDSIGVDVFFEKHGVKFEHHDETLFRGYISTKQEADVILSALRFDKAYSPSVYVMSSDGKLTNQNLT